SKITHGIKASDVYHTANNVFKKKMLHQYFIHGLGHGVGLDIHENPYIRPTRNELLLENMVFSIEPGLYLPWGGIRIEDLVVISQGRAKVLGKTLDEIIEI
ncbi:MAG: Proline aminopeptidase, partial [uncultured bacterium]